MCAPGPGPLCPVLVAGLTRETGVLLIVACAGAALARKDWRQFLNACVATLPVLAWYLYVRLSIPADRSPALALPLAELWKNICKYHPNVRHGLLFMQLCYYLAVLGILLAFFLAIRHFPGSWKSPDGLALLGFTLLGVFVQPPGMWLDVYAFGRTLAPLLVLLGLQYFSTGDWRKALPLGMVSPGILAVSAASGLRVLQGMVHRF